MHNIQEIAGKLTQSGLKVTPQRIAVMQALLKFHHHPTAEEIFREVSQNIPGLSQTTVYNTLGVFVNKGIAQRIATDADVMRYDVIAEPHHHLYGLGTTRVEDYFDPELDKILMDYFVKKKIKGFRPVEIKLHLSGEFDEQK
jgi:Fur family transcriptional regulator, peroxide stress response regulator